MMFRRVRAFNPDIPISGLKSKVRLLFPPMAMVCDSITQYLIADYWNHLLVGGLIDRSLLCTKWTSVNGIPSNSEVYRC